MLREKWLLVLAFVAVAGASGQHISATAGYLTKFIIEKPTSAILAHNTAGVTATGKEFVNPKVEAGRVHWHPSLAVACQAAKKSGKPVFLFQMMGKLDDQFC